MNCVHGNHFGHQSNVLVKVVKSYFLVTISLLLINIIFNNKQFNNDVVIFYDTVNTVTLTN